MALRGQVNRLSCAPRKIGVVLIRHPWLKSNSFCLPGKMPPILLAVLGRFTRPRKAMTQRTCMIGAGFLFLFECVERYEEIF